MIMLGVERANSLDSPTSAPSEATQKDARNFEAIVESAMMEGTNSLPGASPPGNLFPAGPFSQIKPVSTAPLKHAALAYSQQADIKRETKGMSDWEKYKEDQLLRNPGGKNYNLDEKKVSEDSSRQKSFLERVGKDISDVFGNVKNFFMNLFTGSKILYRDQNNEIKEGTQKGLVGSVVDFFKDIGSALSFGLWRPSGEKEPQGFGERLAYSFSKLKDAIAMDIVGGVSGSINHMGKNLVLAGWNLIEVLPDATIGNFEAGRKLTTTIFDDGQVMIEYLTDVAPTGDAWLRVHAGSLKNMKLPLLYNIDMPERNLDDVRWQYVRNTPFRKTIETIGALLADAASIGLLGQTVFSGKADNRHQEMLLR